MRLSAGLLLAMSTALSAQVMKAPDAAQAVPSSPPHDAHSESFHDSRYHVGFLAPAGWSLILQDGEVSTFHLDAAVAPPGSEMRGVASLGFNPFPKTVLSGANFYFSVERHVKKSACAAEVAGDQFEADTQDIDGVLFHHGHDERGTICTEARDDIYTVHRHGSCLRFDLELNTFCSISSGAADLSGAELHAVQQRMADILSSVRLDWKKPAAMHAVPVPVPHRKPGAVLPGEALPSRPLPPPVVGQ